MLAVGLRPIALLDTEDLFEKRCSGIGGLVTGDSQVERPEYPATLCEYFVHRYFEVVKESQDELTVDAPYGPEMAENSESGHRCPGLEPLNQTTFNARSSRASQHPRKPIRG